MPIYNLNNQRYNIPDEVVNDFERDNPDATIAYSAGGNIYDIPVNKKQGFLQKFPDAVLHDDTPQISGQRIDNTISGGAGTQEEADSLFELNRMRLNETDPNKRAALDMKYNEMEGRLNVQRNNQLREQLENNGEIQRLQEIQGRAQLEIDKASFFDRFFNADTRAAVAARDEAEEALEMYSEANRQKDGWFEKNVEGVIRGFADKFGDLRTWDFGASGVSSAVALKDASEKLERGETLTPAEQNMLDAYGLSAAVQAAYQDKVGTAYRVGGSLPESLAFGASFALNPVGGAGRKIAETAAKAAVKKYGTGLVSKLAKGAARVGGDIVEMGVATAVPGAGRVAEDYYNRLNGQSTFDIDNNGIIRYGGQVEQEEADDAIWKAFGSQFIENYSEAMGNYFAPMGTMLSNLTSKGLKAGGLGKLADAVSDISSSQWSKGLQRFKDAVKFDGLIGEYLEEVAGNFMNAATVGDMNFNSPDDPRSVFNPETNLETFLSCALLSGTMYAVEAPVTLYNKHTAKNNLRNADKAASEILGGRWEDLRNQMDSASPQHLAQILTGVQNATDLSDEQKQAAKVYASRLMQYQGYNARMAQNAQESTAETNEANNAYNEGSVNDSPQYVFVANRERTRAAEALNAVDANVTSVIDTALETGESIEPFIGSLDENVAKLARDYYNKSMRLRGVIDGVMDRAEDVIAEEERIIRSVTDPSTGLYTEISRLVTDERGERVSQPGYVVGWIGEGEKRQPVFLAEGMENTEENRIPLKPAEYDASSIQNMPMEDVISLNAEMIRERVKKDLKVKSSMSEQVYNYVPVNGDQVTDENGQVLTITNISPDGVEYQNAEGRIEQMPLDAWKGLMQAQLDANEAQQQQAEEAATNTQAVVENMPRKTDETGRIFVPTSVQGDEVAYDITDAQGNTLEQGTSKVSQFAKMQDYVAPVEEQLNDDGTSGESVGEQVNAEVNNPVVKDNLITERKPMSEEEASGFVSRMNANAEPIPTVEFTPENWQAAFGENGTIETPIGTVKMGENQISKLFLKKRTKEFGMIAPTLSNPDVIIEEPSKAKDGDSERESSYLFVKTFVKDGQKIRYYTSVTVLKEGMEVSISSHVLSDNKVPKKLMAGNVIYIKEALSSNSSDGRLAEQPNAVPDLLPTQENNASLSENKDNKSNVQSQEKEQKPLHEREKSDVFRELGETYGEKMPNKVAVTAKALADDLKKAQQKLDKAIEAYDNAPIGREEKAEKARDKAQQELDAIKREADFWAEMDAEIKSAQMRRNEILNPQAETASSNEPMTADEFVAQQLAAGNIVLNKDDYMRETGYGSEEANAMNGGTAKMFNENGMTIQEAGERLMEMDREAGTNFFNQDDATSGRDALISVLGSVKSRKELNDYIANNRAEQAKRDAEAMRNELEKQVMDANYSSLEDFVLQMEAAEVENPFADVDLDRIDAIFAEAEEEYQNFINNEQGRTSEVVEGNDNVLSEEQSDDTGRTEGIEDEGNSEGNGEGTLQQNEEAHAAIEVELKQQEGETTLQFAERAAEENRRRPLRKRANEWAKALGVKVNFLESIDDVDARTRAQIEAEHAQGNGIPAWVAPNGEVYLFMPDLRDMKDIDETYVHEVVAHIGMEKLLGKERFAELCDKVWDMMPQSEKDYYEKKYPGVKEIENETLRHRRAADEYIAHLAEKENLTPEEKTIWDSIVKMFRDMLDKALNGIIGKSKISDADISNLIKASYANLKSGAEGNVSGEAQKFSAKKKASVSDRSDAVSDNSSSKGLLNGGSAHLSHNPLAPQEDVAKLLKNNEVTISSAKKTINEGGFKGLEQVENAVRLLGTKLKLHKSSSSLSYYGDFYEGDFIVDGVTLHLRLSTHPANGYRIGNSNAEDKVSIVIRKNGKHFSSGEHNGYVEYVYEPEEVSLDDAANAILKGVVNLIAEGEFVDETGKAHENTYPYIDEEGKTRFRRVFHGSGASFDRFDHSFMGSGAGSQVFGWGTYLTESKKIGRDYGDVAGKPRLSYKGEWVDSEDFNNPWRIIKDLFNDHHGRLRDMRNAADRYSRLVDEDNTEMKKLWNEVISKLKEVRSGDLKIVPSRYLYEVEIPDSKRGNYIVWGNNVTDAAAKKVFDGIYNRLVEDEDYDNPTARKELKRELDSLKEAYGQRKSGIWKDLYGDVSSYLGSDKEASLFLRSLGYVGIEYPSGTIMGDKYAGSKNFVIFDENDLRIVDHTRFRVYKSKDGKETKYKQLSLLFDEGNATGNDGGRPDSVQREGDSTIERLNHLRELQEGEVCNVERRFSESKEFSFTRGEKIESTADVAYIFKSLEDEAIENSFVAIANGNDVTIIHLGMGAQTETVVDTSAIVAAVDRLNADKVFFVHNHPSGVVKCSRQDIMTYKGLKNALGEKLQPGIIINTRSGQYGLFDDASHIGSDDISKLKGEEYPLKVYKFNKQAFRSDAIVNVEPHAGSIAEFVSTQRLGKRDKVNALLLNNSFGCVGNVFLPDGKIGSKAINKLAADAVAMGAKNVILYGRAPFVEVSMTKTNFPAYLSDAILRASAGNVRLIDIIQMGEPYNRSAIDEGLRFRVTTEKQKQIDKEYVDAIHEGDFDKAIGLFREYTLSKAEENGVVPIDYAVGYRSNAHSSIAKKVKEVNPDAISEAAYQMSKRVPKGSILVPMPSRGGKATYTVKLAEAIAKATDSEVRDVLRGKERMSVYESKKKGLKVDSDDLGLYTTEELPKDKNVVIIDNVVDRGITALAAVKAVKGGSVLAYAFTKGNKDRVASLKLSDPITYDDDFRIIQLSERFNSDNNDIRFRFIGERGARNLDKAEEATTRIDNLSVAREMESAEKDEKAIKMATGWERGADGKWRYEVDDNISFDTLGERSTKLKKAYSDAQEKYYRFESRVPSRTPKNATEEEKQRIKDMRKELTKLRKEMRKAGDAYYDSPIDNTTLGDFIGEDNNLFKEYPELKDVGISFVRSYRYINQGFTGFYDPETNSIWIDDWRPKGDIRSSLIHEIQHAIQHIEGFSWGGSAAFFEQARAEAQNRKYEFNELINKFGFEDWEKSIPIKELMEYGKKYKGEFGLLHLAFIENAIDDKYVQADLRDELESVKAAYNRFYEKAGGERHSYKTPRDWYLSLGGEVEARNVQQRMGMTDEQRRNTLASETEDVAREDQIFLNGALEEGTRFRRVYHGSGASFDRFDHSFMGTGEGAQAFGWGTYVTDEEGIGKRYAKQMGSEPMLYYKGMPEREAYRKHPELQYLAFFMDKGSSAEEAIEKRKNILNRIVNDESSYWLRKEEAQRGIDWLDSVNPEDIEFRRNRHLYEVEIPDNDGANYLEWDKPLSEENKKRIKDAVLDSKMFKDYAANYGEETSKERLDSWLDAFDTGRVYRLLENFADLRDGRESAKAISMLLNDAGFVGFEYPANYYSGGNEDGSKNYVIFNEHDLDIVEHTRFRLSDKGRKIQNEVDKFGEKYNSKPVEYLDMEMTDEELDAVVPELTNDDLKEILENNPGITGGYSSKTDKIYIFVDNQDLDDMEDTMFHENMHQLLDDNQGLVESFFKLAAPRFPKNIEYLKECGYKDNEIPEELFVRLAAKAMDYGIFDDVIYNLPEDEFEEFKELIKDFGYGYRQEIKSRVLGKGRRRTPHLLEGEEIHETRRAGQNNSGNNSEEEETARKRAEKLRNFFGQVADMGLDGVLGNMEYTRAMVSIFKLLPDEVRSELADKSLRHYKGSIAPAVSDYLNHNAEASIWDKVVGIIREALRKVGFDVELSTNDVKYILWRSQKKLDRNNLLDVAEDIDKKYRLKVGEYNGSPTDGSILEQIKQARADVERNPTEAQKEAGNYKKGHITLDGYEITLENPKGGTRSGTDKNGKKWSITMNNDYGYIRGTEAVDGDHIDVFLSDNPSEGRVFVVDQRNEDGSFDESKVMYGFNSLEEARQAYLSNYENGWESRIMAITEVSKDEFKKWIDSSRKKTKPFSEYKSVNSGNGNTRFRVTNKLNIRDEYEATIKKGSYQAREAVQDAMLSLRRAQELIEKATGKKLRDFENAWIHENRLSSTVQSAIHEMERKFYKPVMDAVKKLMKVANLEQEQVADYLMLKHGIERNREMAVRKALTDENGKIYKQRLEDWYRDKRNVRNRQATPHLDTWRKQQEELDNIALLYGADMSRDYSGLTSMFDTDDLADCTERAYNEVEALENAHPVETEALGKAVKAMTQSSLDKSFQSGLMDKKVYDELSNDMYDYYIPLRGFEETTSDEVYAYLDNERNAFNAPLMRAKGRTSKSDNPLAYMKSIAESGIMQGERNKMKQTFLNMVINNPSDLVSVKEGVWAVYNPATGEWEAASFPESSIPRNATPADVDAAYQQWEADMESRAQQDPNVKKISEADDVPYRVIGNRMNQHQVIVKRLGKSYTLTINGNPRLAMALNGLTNPNNTSNDGKVSAFVSGKIDALNRTLSAWYTTRNPDFVASNFMRDTFYTNTIVRAKEGNRYANKFHKYYAKLLKPGKMLSLFYKYENGTLDASKPVEKDFLDFMMNGGETGYSNLKDLEHIKKQISKELKGDRFAMFTKAAEKLDLLNRAVENTARFAAYRTSRQMGRSIAKSVFDAKEISVNFNKKGSGGTFFGATGQTTFGNLAAMVGAGGRAFYVFFNAAIQGTTNLMHVMKVNPMGTGAGIGAMFLMGAVIPYLFAADDDDEKDYYDIPEHVRRNHLIIPGTGDAWVSIPLPIEYRIMYGMGELLTSWRTGHERGENIGRKMLSLTGQALPLNFLEEGFDAFMPSALSPVWQIYNNESWTGLPIYKDTDFNKHDPEYTKAYKNVDRLMYNFSKSMYEWTFDEENQKARIDLNPAMMETLARGYFGGLATQLSNIGKTYEMIAGEREFDWRSIPVANRLFKSGDERTKEKRITNEYFENIEKLEFLQSRKRLLKKTKDGAAVPKEDKQRAEEDFKVMEGTDVYKKYMDFNDKKKKVDKVYRKRKEKDSKELETKYYNLMEEANKAVR